MCSFPPPPPPSPINFPKSWIKPCYMCVPGPVYNQVLGASSKKIARCYMVFQSCQKFMLPMQLYNPRIWSNHIITPNSGSPLLEVLSNIPFPLNLNCESEVRKYISLEESQAYDDYTECLLHTHDQSKVRFQVLLSSTAQATSFQFA